MIAPRVVLGIAGALFAACSGGHDPATPAPAPAPPPARVVVRPNPLIATSTLSLHAPPFDQIRAEDFPPAYAEGIRAQDAAVRAIVDDPAPPTFDNTIVALDRSSELLDHIGDVSEVLEAAVETSALDKVRADAAPRLAQHDDDIKLDAKLFARIHAVYVQRATLGLDAEDQHLLDRTHRDFVRGGALLSAADQMTLRALDAEEASLQAQYTSRLAADTDAHALVVDQQDDLLGLPWANVKAAAAEGIARHQPGHWIVPLEGSTDQLASNTMVDRAMRERVLRASMMRGHHGDTNDTRATIARIAQIRAQRAHLLGFANHAALVLDDHMAKTPAAIDALIGPIAAAAVPRARAEIATLQQEIDHGFEHFTLAAWDFWLYANRDWEGVSSSVFELDRVLADGVFYTAHQLYGVSFVRRTDLPVYQPDVQVWEVHDADGRVLGLYYLDLYAREGKRGGGWTFTLAAESTRSGTRPIVATILNFAKPPAGQPVALDQDGVSQLFHESGHALDGLLAKVKSPTLAGMTTPRDFVEFPSQLMESWAFSPEIAAHYMVYDDAEKPKLPALLAALDRPRPIGTAFTTVADLQSIYLDLAWHSLPASAPLQDPDALEAATYAAHHVDLPQVSPSYRSTYFSHIWLDGYDAGYYGYLWANVLALDAHAWFVAHGGLTAANGKRFRDLVLARGSSVDPHAAYVEFRGGEPSVIPLLEHLGLVARTPR